MVVRELLDAGFLDGTTPTCTGETLAQQVRRLDPPAPTARSSLPCGHRSRKRVACGSCAATSSPMAARSSSSSAWSAASSTGRSRPRCVFDGERSLIATLQHEPDLLLDGDIVVVRYEGPRGARGCPRCSIPPPASPRSAAQGHHDRAPHRRSLLGRIGRPRDRPRGAEALLGGPIALLEEGDTIGIDLNVDRLDCRELDDRAIRERRTRAWDEAVAVHGGIHPSATPVTSRVLARMRATAEPALSARMSETSRDATATGARRRR